MEGDVKIVDSGPGLLVIERSTNNERVRIVSNLQDASAAYKGSGGDDLLGEAGNAIAGVTLAPYQTAVFKLP